MHITWRELLAVPIIPSFLQIILLGFIFKSNNLEFKRWNISFLQNQGLEDLLSDESYEIEKESYNRINESIDNYQSVKISADTFKNLRTPNGKRALLAGCLVHIMLQ